MATWIVHLRLAENLLQRIEGLDVAQFAIGNIAPDSGIPDENWAKFTPPLEVTHFSAPAEAAWKIADLEFYRRHLAGVPANDAARFSFLLGYFFHLVTDNLWRVKFVHPTKARFAAQFEADPRFDREVKRDWYGLDFAYVRAHPHSLFWRVFLQCEYIDDYLDFLPVEAVRQRIDYIKTFYQRTDAKVEEWYVQRPCLYLSETEMDEFVGDTTQRLYDVYAYLKSGMAGVENLTSALELPLDNKRLCGLGAPLACGEFSRQHSKGSLSRGECWMIKPEVVRQTDEVTILGRVFGTPLVVKGKTWLPITQWAAWGIMAWWAGRRKPARSWPERLGVGALTMPILLGSEWCHNLAHAAAAKWVGKPMDALRVMWGMPLVVYYELDDTTVTPRQHVARALGGPVFNALFFMVAWVLRRFTRPGSAARDAADVAVGTNAFLCTMSLLPIPGIDGGPILKWTLVGRGCTPAQADQTVQKVNGAVGAGLAAASAVAFKRRRHFWGALLAMFGALALGIAFGLIREKK